MHKKHVALNDEKYINGKDFYANNKHYIINVSENVG